jgi:hypothetical protein
VTIRPSVSERMLAGTLSRYSSSSLLANFIWRFRFHPTKLSAPFSTTTPFPAFSSSESDIVLSRTSKYSVKCSVKGPTEHSVGCRGLSPPLLDSIFLYVRVSLPLSRYACACEFVYCCRCRCRSVRVRVRVGVCGLVILRIRVSVMRVE